VSNEKALDPIVTFWMVRIVTEELLTTVMFCVLGVTVPLNAPLVTVRQLLAKHHVPEDRRVPVPVPFCTFVPDTVVCAYEGETMHTTAITAAHAMNFLMAVRPIDMGFI
jgi:hypothetical protein